MCYLLISSNGLCYVHVHVGAYSRSPCHSFEVVSHGPDACACPGDKLTYQCSNSETTTATVWRSSALKCFYQYEIYLRHSRCCYSATCNYGATRAQIVRIENGCHISQLNITVESRSALDNKTITCLGDNGTRYILTGQTIITPTAGKIIIYTFVDNIDFFTS